MHKFMTMPSFATTIAFGLFLFSVQASAQTTSSKWTGALDAQGNQLRLEIKLEKKDDRYRGVLLSLDQGNAQLELEKIKLDNKKFNFDVKVINAKFRGKLSYDGKTAKGT